MSTFNLCSKCGEKIPEPKPITPKCPVCQADLYLSECLNYVGELGENCMEITLCLICTYFHVFQGITTK